MVGAASLKGGPRARFWYAPTRPPPTPTPPLPPPKATPSPPSPAPTESGEQTPRMDALREPRACCDREP
ncbi:hypothetical protein SCA03_46060 [Streptomyces cacaoi]|uniref:Uncharacterized protein n=1 Tax=Streptomyces cacaoi TaxID=1898 RepID=A0A4Y3R2U1_STRCI|nr:hypothetical protein SCA03_46060 [Streptomyces cacaoi]